MQFVNDDMNDELFRRAAEEYPLNTDSGDWDSVMKKMQAGDNNKQPGKKADRYKYLFLSTLIPLLLICTTYIKNDAAIAENNIEKGNKTVEYPLTRDKVKLIETTALPKTKIVKPHESTNESKQSFSNQEKNFFDGDDGHKVKDDFIAKSNGKQKMMQTTIDNNLIVNSKINRNRPGNAEISADKIAIANKALEQAPTNQSSSIIGPEKKTITLQPEVVSAQQKTVTEEPKSVTEQPKEAASVPTTAATMEKKEKTVKKAANKFYFGFQGGPDFSMVKSTDIHGTGYSVGLLAGYNLNKKLAIETGLLWDRKKYHSKGEYFDTKRLNWSYVSIIDLSGYCDMYEIPLNLRYNLASNSKRTWFANAGMSSYLMKKENYDYSYVRYGIPGKGNREYKNTTNNWLSIAHVSIGLQKKLGNIGDLRIEPYVKLPVNGVGIGSMPLRSTGIYFGLTRPVR